MGEMESRSFSGGREATGKGREQLPERAGGKCERGKEMARHAIGGEELSILFPRQKKKDENGFILRHDIALKCTRICTIHV